MADVITRATQNSKEAAFARPDVGDALTDGQTGLTKREEFARSAMIGLLAAEGRGGQSFKTRFDLSIEAVRQADSLLLALARYPVILVGEDA